MKKMTTLLSAVLGVLVAGVAMANEGAVASSGAGFNSYAMGAALIMMFATATGAYSQSKAATAALEGITRNPQSAEKVTQPLVLSLALMESLVLFSFVIAIILATK